MTIQKINVKPDPYNMPQALFDKIGIFCCLFVVEIKLPADADSVAIKLITNPQIDNGCVMICSNSLKQISAIPKKLILAPQITFFSKGIFKNVFAPNMLKKINDVKASATNAELAMDVAQYVKTKFKQNIKKP